MFSDFQTTFAESNLTMRKKMVFLIGMTILICTLPSCQSKKQVVKSIGVVPVVDGFVVSPSSIKQIISVSGTIKSFEETVLMPEVTGRVVAIHLPEGQSVKKGTLLVKLFDADLQASLKKSNAQLQIAEQTAKRQAELLKINGISQLDYDQSVLQVNSITADIENFEALISKTEIKAPFDGILGLRTISVGAEITPGTPVVTIRALQQLKLDFSVPEKYSSQIKAGMKINFSVQGDEQKYDATVLASEEGIDIATRNLNVRAIINNKNAALKPGAFANVDLELKEIKNALMVPTQAIIPQEQNKQLIIAKNGKATFVTVQTGVRQSSNIEITKGIAAGDTIVTTGILFLKQGASIKFSKVSQ